MRYFVNPGRVPIITLVLTAIMLCRLVAFAAEKPIIFAGDSDFPPVEYLEKEIPKDLHVDLLRELSKAMGREIDIRLMHWEDAQQKVLRGEIDAITTMAITEKRKELYDFSEVTLRYQYSLFVRTEQVGLETKEDLQGKTVAVTEGGLPKQVLESIPGIKFVFVEDYLEGFRRLLAQEIDAVAADRWVGAYTLEKNNIRGITIREKPFAQKQAGIAVKKGNAQLLDDINLGIRKLIDDGTIQRIEDDWSSKEVLFLTREALYEKAVYGVAALLLVVSGVAFFWILTLRKANNSLRESRRMALHPKDEALEAHRQTEQALEELHQSRMDLDRAQEVGQIGWWRLDTERNVLTWSDQNHHIFGVPQGTPLTYETFLGCVHPDDRPSVDTLSKAGLDGEPYEFEHRILVNGQIKWVREKAYAEFDDTGKLLGRFGITQDITARKRSDQERQTTVEFLRLVNQSKSTAELQPTSSLRYPAAKRWAYGTGKATIIPIMRRANSRRSSSSRKTFCAPLFPKAKPSATATAKPLLNACAAWSSMSAWIRNRVFIRPREAFGPIASRSCCPATRPRRNCGPVAGVSRRATNPWP
jgi:PAS domain S-box-containing protein